MRAIRVIWRWKLFYKFRKTHIGIDGSDTQSLQERILFEVRLNSCTKNNKTRHHNQAGQPYCPKRIITIN